MDFKEKELIELIKGVAEINKEIDINDSLIYDLGMSSFEMCMLACELEIKSCKTVDYKKFNHTTTVKDLCKLL